MGGMDQLGLVGGTFDPPHVGHMLVGSHARRALGLSRVLYVVAPAPWQKADRIISAPEERLALVELACAAHDGLEASDIEIQANEVLRMRTWLEETWAKHSNRSVEQVRKDIERDKILIAPEAKEYGLIDDVLESRKASLQD